MKNNTATRKKEPLTPEQIHQYVRNYFYEDDPRFKTVEEIKMILDRTKEVYYDETLDDLYKLDAFAWNYAKFDNLLTAFKWFYPKEDYDYYKNRPANPDKDGIPVYYDHSTMRYMIFKRNKAFFIDPEKKWVMCYGKH